MLLTILSRTLVLNREWILPTLEDIWQCLETFLVITTWTYRVEARDTGKYPTMHRTALHNKESSNPKHHSAKAEKSCSKLLFYRWGKVHQRDWVISPVKVKLGSSISSPILSRFLLCGKDKISSLWKWRNSKSHLQMLARLKKIHTLGSIMLIGIKVELRSQQTMAYGPNLCCCFFL